MDESDLMRKEERPVEEEEDLGREKPEQVDLLAEAEETLDLTAELRDADARRTARPQAAAIGGW